MFSRLKNLFSRKKKQEKSVFDIVQSISIGSSVKLKFKDPRNLGLIDPSNSLTLRYDPEDLIKKIIIGTLLTKKNINGMLFLEFGCFKMRNGMRVERTYTLMLEEIEHIEEVK